MLSADGATYAPAPMPEPVVAPGEFVIAAMHLDHGHIYGMCEALIGAGATLKWVYDPDPMRVADFHRRFPGVRVARAEAEVLDDPEVRLVAGAAIASERCALGLRVMDAGKDYFTDKAPLTTLDQLAAAREATERTGRKYAVYYAERIHVEAAVLAGQLIDQGAIGRVLHVDGFGPHRLGTGRPDWFFERERYGGILCDIGSHNFEQLLAFTGAQDGEIVSANIANYAHPETPGLDDFGDAHVVLDNAATGYVRVDWFTPGGLSTWGDGRTFIVGTEGFIELRKYANLATGEGPGHLFLVDGEGEHHINATGTVGYPFFGQLILDCLERTETAMTQAHAFKAAELSVVAQLQARVLAGAAAERR
ncbi:Gfo/Idh/MocA family oxidoreductase [Microbacterium sp. NPDC096154]|uniref:Gfo/Idh/MocA family protein n=1 Tax=Microbacterium sp. NPDC096154 TaxID=3155549 RepID=UPI00331C599A